MSQKEPKRCPVKRESKRDRKRRMKSKTNGVGLDIAEALDAGRRVVKDHQWEHQMVLVHGDQIVKTTDGP